MRSISKAPCAAYNKMKFPLGVMIQKDDDFDQAPAWRFPRVAASIRYPVAGPSLPEAHRPADIREPGCLSPVDLARVLAREDATGHDRSSNDLARLG